MKSLTYFNTSNFTSLKELFYACNCLTTIDVTNYCTNKVTSLRETFYSCYSLETITGLGSYMKK